MKRFMVMVGALALCALPAMAGEWHSGQNLLCTDCHTIHFSQSHNWDGSTPVPTTAAPDGNWLGATGPNHYLLKAPANELCLACHDGQTFAPDVYGTNVNASPSQGRMAGALNGAFASYTPGANYEDWKGHTLETVAPPPGYNPALVGPGGDTYPAGTALECINCHAQHGPEDDYRNLAPYSWPFMVWSQARPTYVIDTTNDASIDVWINIPSTYTANSGLPATFNPYYDYANIFYNRNDGVTAGGTTTSNRMDTFCAGCHGTFHGGPGDADIGGVADGAGYHEFDRHPTSGIDIGLLGGGHSGLGFYQAAVTAGAAVKVYTTDHTATTTDPTPGCVSCHKAHGNQNPFGLFFLDPNATAIDEEGGDHPTHAEMANGYGISYQGLCGQCHTQGINVGE